ncbi:MAG: TIGR01906 family membrane protein [Chloroflexi bacterium]|nr:TIGR01906 family membrane protein [Chloroflexota bacterium]
MPRWLANVLMAILVVLMPPFIVLSNLYLFLTPQYLDFEYGKSDFPKADRFDDQVRRYNAAQSIEYERGNINFEAFQGLGVYNEREINHMVDVRVLIAQVTVFHAMDGLLLLVILATLASSAVTRALAARGLFVGGLLTIALFGAIGFFAATGFDTFFTDFHHVFFSGDTWLFNYSDSLIQFYPVRFWFDTALYLAGLTIVEALIAGAVGWVWEKRLRIRAGGNP